MLKRNILTLTFASLLSILLIAAWFVYADGEELLAVFPMAFFISWFAIPVILLNGLPVSLLSEKLTKRFSNNQRICWSFVIHAIFGLGFIFIVGLLFESQTLIRDFSQFWRSYEMFFIASIITSICFWVIDECLRFCLAKKAEVF
ncbi:hypothetical protein QTL97_09440 [Sporosarcina thermotolerans]|uniref:Lipoprotein n=1 Tax=Sporosarcina thermotolerans TaxID=633404 RepID=A0AAW9A806_9BACL|nr:hypothetical protein [Sporosarcina thermotolerans]MDW0117159.1 hypothetical protein [Sporosarcina thermotolerans]